MSTLRNWQLISLITTAGVITGLFYYYIISTGPCSSNIQVIRNPQEMMPDSNLYVPINVVIASPQNDPIPYDRQTLQRSIDFANTVWSKAGITFEIKQIQHVDVPAWRAIPFQLSGDLCRFGKDFVGSKFEDQVVDVIIVKDFWLSDGGRTVQQGIIGAAFIEEFDEEYRADWTLAHELGHALNLNHADGIDNLMFNANAHPGILEDRPVNLTQEQITTSRLWAYSVRCPDFSCVEE